MGVALYALLGLVLRMLLRMLLCMDGWMVTGMIWVGLGGSTGCYGEVMFVPVCVAVDKDGRSLVSLESNAL